MKLPILVGALLAVAAAADAAPKASSPSLPTLSAEQIVDRHVTAIGGLDAWRNLRSVVMEGQMDAGGKPVKQLPYVLKLKRGHKSRLEITFNDQVAVQIYDGQHGWKVRPFTNRKEVETMTATELAAAATGAADDLDGPLVDFRSKGSKVTLTGTDVVRGHAAYRLKLSAKGSADRSLWIDGQNFMLLRVDGEPRSMDSRVHPVSIYYSDFRAEKGLTYPHTQETVVEQSKAVPTKLTYTKVLVNESVDDSAFAKPDLPDAQPGRAE